MNHKDLEENFICLDGYPQECKNVSYDCRKCQKALDNCKFRDSFIGNHELETMRYCYCISCKKLGFSCNGKLRSSEDCLKYEGY